MLPNPTTLKNFFFFFHLRGKKGKTTGMFAAEGGGGGKKLLLPARILSVTLEGGECAECSRAPHQHGHRPETNISSAGGQRDRIHSVDGFHWNVTHVFSLLNSHACALQGRFKRDPRRWGGEGGGSWSSYQRNTSARTACPFASAQWNSCLRLRHLCLGHTVVTVTSATRG